MWFLFYGRRLPLSRHWTEIPANDKAGFTASGWFGDSSLIRFKQFLKMLPNPQLIFAKNSDENNLAVPDNCRFSPTLNPADELWLFVNLWVSTNVENVQALQRDPALPQ